MKKLVSLSVFAASAGAFAALPTISGVTVTQDAATRRVTVSYVVSDADAIVTCQFQTNGVPVAGRVVRSLSGTVNMRVDARTEAYSFTWNPDFDLGPDAALGALTVKLAPWAVDDPPPYLAIDLTLKNTYFFYDSANDVPGGVQDRRYKTHMLLLRRIPAKNCTFRLGLEASDVAGEADYEIAHDVTLTKDFYMAVYETTVRQSAQITGAEYGAGASFDEEVEVRPAANLYTYAGGGGGSSSIWSACAAQAGRRTRRFRMRPRSASCAPLRAS